MHHKTTTPFVQLRASSTQLALHSFTCPLVGFKLLGVNLGSSTKIIKRAAVGHLLDRSERTMLQQTLVDWLKLASLSTLFLIPFASILLPVIAYKFPRMIPSTFFETRYCLSSLAVAQTRQSKLAEIWHQQIKDLHISDLVKGTDLPQAEEILAFQEGHAGRLRLDFMSKHQLHSLATLLGLTPAKVTSVLKWQLRRYMTRIRREDRDYVFDGVDRLSELELAESCKKRAIPFHGLSKTDMQNHLRHWTQVSSQMDISMCVLLWMKSSFNFKSQEFDGDANYKDVKSELSANLHSALALQSDVMQQQHQIDKHQSKKVAITHSENSLDEIAAMVYDNNSLEKEKLKIDEMQAQFDDIMNSLLKENDDLQGFLTVEDSRIAGFAPSMDSSTC